MLRGEILAENCARTSIVRHPRRGVVEILLADGALLVYDVTDKNSFDKVTRWVTELRDAVGDDITISIAGNKIDLAEHRQVDEQEAVK